MKIRLRGTLVEDCTWNLYFQTLPAAGHSNCYTSTICNGMAPSSPGMHAGASPCRGTVTLLIANCYPLKVHSMRIGSRRGSHLFSVFSNWTIMLLFLSCLLATSLNLNKATLFRGPRVMAEVPNKCMATYSWRQSYWAGDDTTLIDFFKTPEAKEYNCGDIYFNIADASNEGQQLYPERLADFLKQFREVSGNTATIYLFYAGGAPGYNDSFWALDFVRLFENFVVNYTQPSLGPIGISFNVELPRQTWLEIFDKTDEMKKALYGYDVKVDVSLHAVDTNRRLVDTIMFRSDHVTVTTFSNTAGGLYNKFKIFLNETCPNCNNDYYCNYKAKITFLGEGDCTVRQDCSVVSMCARFSACPDDPNGGILYAFNTMQKAFNVISGDILPSYRFNHFFPPNETHIGLNYFEWVRCFYGYETWIKANLTECESQYYTLSQQCNAQ